MKAMDKAKIYTTELTCIVKGTGITFLGKVLDSGLRFLYMVILAKSLGPDLFGILLLGLTIVILAGTTSTLGLDIGAVRYVSIYHGLGDRQRMKGTIVQASVYSFIIGALIAAGLFVGSTFLSLRVFGKSELETVLKLLALSVPFFSTTLAVLSCTQGLRKMKYSVYCWFSFYPFINVMLAVLFLFAGFRLYGLAVASTIALLLTCVLSVFFLIRCFPDIKHIKPVYETRKLLRFSIPSLGGVLLSFFMMCTDTLMLGYFRTSDEVGIYNAATRTALLIVVTLASSCAIFAPIVSNAYNKKELHKLESLYKAITRWNFSVSFPIFLLILVLSKQIMGIFGQGYIIGYMPLTILACAQLANAGVGPGTVILAMTGRQDIVMCNNIGACILNIVLNYLLVPSYGIIGAAVATGISITLLNLVTLLEVRIILDMHPYSRQFIKPLSAGLTAFAALVLMTSILQNLAGIPKILVSVPIFSALFIWLLFKWGINCEDLHILTIFKAKLAGTMPSADEKSVYSAAED
ncbi:MAG: flippase [Planctomycetota bacterium]|jgi:O-antigen/teichoic acid export membrane protein